jgi:signal transduction histidine kinase
VDASAPGKLFDLTLGDSDQIMALGVRPPPGRRGISGPVREMIVTLAGALLFVGASTIAWIMTIRKKLLAEQLEVERARHRHLEELGMAAAGLAHETKNPLGIILGLAQQIARNPREPEESRAMVEHIVDEVDKATARVGDFMTFARQRKANATPLDARGAAAKVGEILQSDFDRAGVTLTLDCPSLSILADEEMFQQVLVNLLLNSLRASSAGTAVTVRLAREGALATLTIADQGAGIPPELLPNICKPYVAGHPGGHGLGLAIVKRLVEEHGWRLSVASQVGRGTDVTVSGIRVSASEEAGA